MSSPSSWICDNPITPATIASAVTGERQEPYGLICGRVDTGRAIATRLPDNRPHPALPHKRGGEIEAALRAGGGGEIGGGRVLFRGVPRRRVLRPRGGLGQRGGHHRIFPAVRA